jgi:uncharacterized protein YdaU (DUF1376 family)
MSGPRFVRFYASDWRSGCIGMTPEEEGFYIRVCAHFWETGVRVPLDDMIAAGRLMLDVRKYRRLKTKLIEKGKLHVAEDGIYSPRSETEYSAATRAIGKEAEAEPMATARGQHDRQHADGRNQVEGRDTSAHPVAALPGDIGETSARSLGEVSENFANKPNEINGPLKSRNQSLKGKIIPLTPKGGPTPSQALEAFNAYNETALRCGLPQASRMTPDRQRKIIARLRDYGLDGWGRALKNIETCDFLRGSNNTGWRASLDFLLQASSFAKAHDGVYGRGEARPKPISDAARKTQNAFDVLARMRMEAAQ